ncbi:transcriptional regulator [Bradyrhizobium japonicum]|uniref:transcriptional regulator n=1 Tax=Bradyrhizobium japonicum TaxID=375 RepID=UPI001BABAC3C|nr:transcriptional regulator [Bradyrhizobium japonicum]
MRYEKQTFVEKARLAWGTPAPDWIQVLAEEADRVTATRAAKNIGYSAAVLSHVFANNYKGDLGAVEQKVRGALLGVKVMCPVYGEIGRDQCLDLQKNGPPFSSEASGRCYRSCRGIGGIPKCPNSRIPDGAR